MRYVPRVSSVRPLVQFRSFGVTQETAALIGAGVWRFLGSEGRQCNVMLFLRNLQSMVLRVVSISAFSLMFTWRLAVMRFGSHNQRLWQLGGMLTKTLGLVAPITCPAGWERWFIPCGSRRSYKPDSMYDAMWVDVTAVLFAEQYSSLTIPRERDTIPFQAAA